MATLMHLFLKLLWIFRSAACLYSLMAGVGSLAGNPKDLILHACPSFISWCYSDHGPPFLFTIANPAMADELGNFLKSL